MVNRLENRVTVRTAAQLALLLDNVQPITPREGRTYSADAPCHESKKPGMGDSFTFGDGPGGLLIDCWQCKAGRGSLFRMRGDIEELLNINLELAHLPPLPLELSRSDVGRPMKPAQPHGDGRGPRFFEDGPEKLTLGDMYEARLWFPAHGKAAWQSGTQGHAAGYRHSLADEDGGLVMARHGTAGQYTARWKGKPFRVYPWQNYQKIATWCSERPRLGCVPALSLAGEEGLPSPLPLVIIDADYKPHRDETGAGAVMRDRLEGQFRAAGFPVFGSSSGNGWHSIAVMGPEARKLAMAGDHPQHYPEKPGSYYGSLEIEVFPAGTKRHLVIRTENPRGNNDPTTIIPMLELAHLEEMLRRAQPIQAAPEQGGGTVTTLDDQPAGNKQDETGLDQEDAEKPRSALDIEHDGDWYPPGGDWDTYLGWDTANNCWLPQEPDPAPRRRSKRTQTEH